MSRSAPIEPLPFPVLVGDVGGTNARFALLADPQSPPQLLPLIATADYSGLEAVVQTFVLPHTRLRPRAAVIDIAGPITGDAARITNAEWVIRPAETIRVTGIEDVVLLNDFEALALALPALVPEDLEQLGNGSETAAGAKVVLGPGTGLGVGALVPAGGIWAPVPGEGGHVEFGPAEADEFAVWAHLEAEHGRVEAETILCGRGIVQLYRALIAAEGGAALHDNPAAVTDAALAGSDPAAVRTLALFCRMLGRFAGDMALIFMARGGVYLGGGIPPRILPLLQGSEFRRAFEAKRPHHGLMQSIPTWVITRENPALAGLAAFSRDPNRFAVALEGRRWRPG
jgi:glucokinase